MGILEVLSFRIAGYELTEYHVSEPLRHHGPPGVVLHEAFTDQPTDGGSVLEQRIHPGVRMRVTRRRGAVHRVTTGVCGHGHDGIATRSGCVQYLRMSVVLGVVTHDHNYCIDDMFIGAVEMGFDLRIGILDILAAIVHEQVQNRLGKPGIRFFVLNHECLEPFDADLLQFRCFFFQSIGFRSKHGTHIRLRQCGDGTEDRFLTASGAGSVT